MDRIEPRLLTPSVVLRLAAVVLLAGGIFMANPMSVVAQNQGSEQKPPERDEGAKADPEEAEQRAKEERKALEEYEQAAEGLPPRAGTPECVWTGRRIASLLWRDDLGTAERYMDLYRQFDCSPEHLKLAFRCVIKQGPLDPKAAEELAARVHDCWVLPEEPGKEASRATTSTRNGTKPK
jgi:hypothetical protein